jgi:hypothetical protein
MKKFKYFTYGNSFGAYNGLWKSNGNIVEFFCINRWFKSYFYTVNNINELHPIKRDEARKIESKAFNNAY